MGAPPAILALLSVAAPMSLLRHLSNGATDHVTPERHHLHFNITAPFNTAGQEN